MTQFSHDSNKQMHQANANANRQLTLCFSVQGKSWISDMTLLLAVSSGCANE